MALSESQQAELIAVIKGKSPDQLRLRGVLWSRAAVKALIDTRFGIALRSQTVGIYLRRWGVLWFSAPGQEARAALA